MSDTQDLVTSDTQDYEKDMPPLRRHSPKPHRSVNWQFNPNPVSAVEDVSISISHMLRLARCKATDPTIDTGGHSSSGT